MAVTQQIARIPQTTLTEATVDAAVVERLLRFELVDRDDVLDLDWAPFGLLALARRSLTDAHVAALQALLTGSQILNEQCAQGPEHDPVYSDVTCLLAAEVQRASQVLAGLTPPDILRSFPTTRSAQEEIVGAVLPDDAAGYYSAQFTALLDFAQGAADRKLGLVQWWD